MVEFSRYTNHFSRPQFRPSGNILIRTLITIALAGLVTCYSYLHFLGNRLDYVGHYAAGFGGTLFLLAVVFLRFHAVQKKVSASCLVTAISLISICMGGLLEATVFRLAIFDPVDFCNQSFGAIVAGLTFIAAPPPLPLARQGALAVLFLSVLFLILGFYWAFS